MYLLLILFNLPTAVAGSFIDDRVAFVNIHPFPPDPDCEMMEYHSALLCALQRLPNLDAFISSPVIAQKLLPCEYPLAAGMHEM
ncbi:hypothetical protein F4809DRAFT_594129 [Biscogniauxia mediterranea]|nr:hypothetical protein F4809DRAFT_594129 [Biscogniauxia mediterranea]